MIYIIGTGLSGMAAATALVRRGIRPVVLDAGLEPDPAAQEVKNRLASLEPGDWNSADVAAVRRTGPAAANGIPRKLYFGSDFTHRDADLAAPMEVRTAALSRSLAAGGFSNVWGGVMEPLPEVEFQRWPVPATDLAPHYRAVSALFTGAAGVDGLPEGEFGRLLRPSRQAETLQQDLFKGQAALAASGIRWAAARLAALDGDGPNHCRHCGLCLFGCPYDCLYSGRHTLARLRSEGAVDYRPGLLVEALRPGPGGVEIVARALSGGSTHRFMAERVFLAAGLPSTVRIVLASLDRYDTPVRVRHSDIFTLPVIRRRAGADPGRDPAHTLCLLTMAIEHPAVGPHPVHLQWYGYNDLYASILRRCAGPAAPVLAPALRAAARRLFTVFGYIHSDTSSSLELRLAAGPVPQLRVIGRPAPEAARIARAAARCLWRQRRTLRAIPLLPCLRLDLPGGGYHTGSAFPMRSAPQDLESDRWGVLPALPGAHLVDASVLPSVPAAPLAFTATANAHRIAAGCPLPHGA